MAVLTIILHITFLLSSINAVFGAVLLPGENESTKVEMDTNEGTGGNARMELRAVSAKCDYTSAGFCNVEKPGGTTYYTLCQPKTQSIKKCPAGTLNECRENGTCHTCVTEDNDCSITKPCCKAQSSYNYKPQSRGRVYRCVAGRCVYCVKYGLECISRNNIRDACCATPGKGFVECRNNGDHTGDGVCLDNACDGGKKIGIPVAGFLKKVYFKRCDAPISGEKTYNKVDYECRNDSCVQCLAADQPCANTKECCKYLKCINGRCDMECGVEYFRCNKASSKKQCCKGLKCFEKFCVKPNVNFIPNEIINAD